MRRMAVALSAVVLAVAACGGDDDTGGVGSPDGGVRVDVVNLTSAGAEPHDLELTPRQVERIEDADLVLVMGREFQPAVEAVAARRRSGTIVVLDALPIDAPGTVSPHDHGHDDDGHDDDGHDDDGHDDDGHDDDGHDAGAGTAGSVPVRLTTAHATADTDDQGRAGDVLDPHVWLDVRLMRELVHVVEEALAEVDPAGSEHYEANGARDEAELEALDAEFESGLARCARREIVTAHDAFGWMAKRYGLEQHAVSGLSPDEEPTANRLAELADLVRDDGITTIFTETLVSPRVAETLAREAGGVRTAVLSPLEGLTTEQANAGADYVSVMRENLAALRAALDCE